MSCVHNSHRLAVRVAFCGCSKLLLCLVKTCDALDYLPSAAVYEPHAINNRKVCTDYHSKLCWKVCFEQRVTSMNLFAFLSVRTFGRTPFFPRKTEISG